jgi:ubiquinone/menaquinone biosynthesis C-methylase UbiE
VFDVDERVHDPEELFTTYGHRSPKRRNRQCKWEKVKDMDDLDDPAAAEDVRLYWDTQAATFDTEPDHGLLSPDVRAAWAEVLLPELASPPGRVADLGCGTGSIALLLAEAGYDVQGVDLSDAMVAAAKAKMVAAGVTVDLRQGDAAFPPFEPASFDVVLSRHVLWALENPAAVLGRWIRLLKPGGRLVLIEGHWPDGSGITAARCRELVTAHREETTVRLLADSRLWGTRFPTSATCSSVGADADRHARFPIGRGSLSLVGRPRFIYRDHHLVPGRRLAVLSVSTTATRRRVAVLRGPRCASGNSS